MNNYVNLLQKAIEIARQAHRNQTDKSGQPYWGHVSRVMRAGRTLDEKIVGILHDVVEDTDWTFEGLLQEGFPPHIVAAISCVTKISEAEPYDRFIERVKTNPLAVAVKLNDLRDNMDLTRLNQLTDADCLRNRKYLAAYRELVGLEPATLLRKIVYIDMDNVLVDFQSGIDRLDATVLSEYENRLDEVPHIFSKMQPKADAVESFNRLAERYDVYILSTAPWNNPSAWSDKLEWVKRYLGDKAYKRLILTHHKNLNKGDYLIDDRTKNGADCFEGELILFGSDEFPDWKTVVKYLCD